MAAAAPQKTVAILGGGISGLSTAYYIRKKYGDLVKSVIFERTSSVGGWIKTVQNGNNFLETGPRSIRPMLLAGMNTLDMVEDIGLDKNVLYIPSDHPASQNRFIFTKGKLVKLPTDLRMLFRTIPPFERPLFRAGLRDIFRRRVTDEDDSIFDFVERRFGRDAADYLIDPMIRGICAGDAKEVSVKLLMRQWYYYEQKYGSVLLGTLINKIFKKPSQADLLSQIPGYEKIGFSKLALTSREQKWATWSLENGLQSLVNGLQLKLMNEMDTTILMDSAVKSIKFSESRNVPSTNIEIRYVRGNEIAKQKFDCDYVISTIPSWRFSKILRKSTPSEPSLWQLMNLISAADVIVANVVFKNRLDILSHDAFGFLVPSNEVLYTPSVEGLLGIVFDTCSIVQGNDTVLTIISHPTTSVFDSKNPLAEVNKLVRQYLKTTLGIDTEPSLVNVSFSMECIPQYNVGHYEKVDGIRMFIRAVKMPLIVCGACYDGVSVNDCIYSARKAAEDLPFHNLLPKIV